MIRLLESKPFLFFFRDHLRSTLGITCGRGSFAVHFGDHLRSRDQLRLGIICGTVQLRGPGVDILRYLPFPVGGNTNIDTFSIFYYYFLAVFDF